MDDFAELQAAADRLAVAVKHVAGSAPVSIAVTSRTSKGVGSVSVSVGGRLQNVELTPAAMELPPDRLASAIQAAYVAACQDATGRARTLIADTTRDHPQFAGFFDELLHDGNSPVASEDNAGGRLDPDDPDEDGFRLSVRG